MSSSAAGYRRVNPPNPVSVLGVLVLRSKVCSEYPYNDSGALLVGTFIYIRVCIIKKIGLTAEGRR